MRSIKDFGSLCLARFITLTTLPSSIYVVEKSFLLLVALPQACTNALSILFSYHSLSKSNNFLIYLDERGGNGNFTII